MSNEIEDLLGRMPLRQPAPSMDAKVLRAPHRGRRILWWAAVGGAVGAAAAVLLVAFTLFTDDGDRVARDTNPPVPIPKTPTVAKTDPAPVRLEQNWSTVAYEGVVVPDDRTPLRQFRRRMFERVEWIDEARGTRMEMTIPREEVILIKATAH